MLNKLRSGDLRRASKDGATLSRNGRMRALLIPTAAPAALLACHGSRAPSAAAPMTPPTPSAAAPVTAPAPSATTPVTTQPARGFYCVVSGDLHFEERVPLLASPASVPYAEVSPFTFVDATPEDAWSLHSRLLVRLPLAELT